MGAAHCPPARGVRNHGPLPLARRRYHDSRSGLRKHLRTVFGDGNSVLEVRGEAPVRCHDAPAVFELDGGGLADSDLIAAQACVSTSGPSSVTAIVCSKCAERLPSAVTTLQPSSSSMVSGVPMLTIGSIAKTLPTFILGPGVPGQ